MKGWRDGTSSAQRVCLVAEPIHSAGTDLLVKAGLSIRHASSRDLASIPGETSDVDAIIVRGALPREAMDASPRLLVIGNHGTGTDAVDIAHASALGIPVVNTPASNVSAVAEHAIMLMLATARRVVAADAATRLADTRFKNAHQTMSLSGKILGVIGYGHTGARVAQLAFALGMEVLVWSPRASADVIAASGARQVSTLNELLSTSDVVSLHRPLRADTRHTLDRNALALLKPNAIVVNTSRGGLIDEEALAAALRERRLFGAGLDVLADEPMAATSPLRDLPNVVLTPHSAGSTVEALRETALRCAEQVVAVLQGRRPASLVDPGVWPRRRLPQGRPA
jgi:D-3-phosphoglycerate dehydrogenase / 2-oxoglutarate reductase